MGEPFLLQIDNIFTKDECHQLIERASLNGMTEVKRTNYAKYDRTIIVDEDLANRLYMTYKDRFPPSIRGMVPSHVNSTFRFSKYNEGGEFKIHKDGINQDSRGGRSIATLNIFLNDDFEGGETDFYKDDQTTLRYSAAPSPGRGMLFDSQQYHCGNMVKNGIKWLIRTDLMSM